MRSPLLLRSSVFAVCTLTGISLPPTPSTGVQRTWPRLALVVTEVDSIVTIAIGRATLAGTDNGEDSLDGGTDGQGDGEDDVAYCHWTLESKYYCYYYPQSSGPKAPLGC